MPAATDVLAVAKSKLGEAETPPGSNHNEITQWYGTDGPWCAMFVSWVLAHAGFSTNKGATLNVPGVTQTTTHGWAYVPYLLNNFRDAGLVYVDPVPGDIVTYDWDPNDESRVPDHTGFVESLAPDGSIWAIEGNTSGGQVARRHRSRVLVAAFCRPPYAGVARTALPTVPPGLPAFPGYCSIGSRDNATRAVQQRLRDRGWSIDVDGAFGPQTLRVVKAFQSARGLPVDGVVGPLTWSALVSGISVKAAPASKPVTLKNVGITPGASAGAPPPSAATADQQPLTPGEHPTYHNGQLIENVEITALFVGAAWAEGDPVTVSQHVKSFLSYFVTSELIDKLAAFNKAGWAVGHGTVNEARFLTGTPVANSISDDQVQSFLKAAIDGGDAPPSNFNSLYVLCFPPDVVIRHPHIGSSCADHCGYHSNLSGIPYVVIPYLSCGFCLPPNTSVADAMTAVLSHELSESITNPLGTGWFADDADQSEIADLCNSDGWSTKRVGGFLVQRFCPPTGACW